MKSSRLVVPTVRIFRKYLAKQGFIKRPKRGKGDHELWVHNVDPTRRVLLDPGQDPPKVGTFKQMLKNGQLPEEDFR